MARVDGKSLSSLILDQEKHDIEYPKYLKILKRLTKSTNVSVDEYFAKLVNFKKNQAYPKHNWFDYKHGYSEDLVKAIIASSGISDNDMILDPFCGVGTTNVVAQSLGLKNIGYDISPIALLAARVKTIHYKEADKSS
jgi:DNA modification methylase